VTVRDDASGSAAAGPPDPSLPSRDELVAVVREAAQRVRDMRGRGLHARPGGEGGDPVTGADRASERLLAGRLREIGPPARILSEAAGEVDADQLGRWEWVVDPLDGRVNHAGGRPWYGVSVALRERGGAAPAPTPLAAACWPEMGFAVSLADGGALDHRTGAPPRVSGRDALRGAVVAVAVDPRLDPGLLRRTTRLVAHLLEAGAGFRVIGCASYELALVAAGRLDGFVLLGRDPFATAAVLPIVRDAGGRVTGTGGEPTGGERPGIVATNGRIHEELLEVVGSVGAAGPDA